MRVIVINVEEESAKVCEIEKELQAYYDALNCNLIEIHTFMVAGRPYAFICDEEGVYRSAKISAISDLGFPMLVGNLIICNNTEDETDVVSLTDEDIEHLRKHIHNVYTRKFPEGYPALCQCDFRL